MPDEQEEIKLHPRLSGVDFSEKMVIGLLKKDTMGRDTWLVAALRQRNRQALASVEEALARLKKRSDLVFFLPSGNLHLDPGESQKAVQEILILAKEGKLLQDIVHTQILMPKVGVDYNGRLIRELESISSESLQIYQLLGVQMQLFILIGG